MVYLVATAVEDIQFPLEFVLPLSAFAGFVVRMMTDSPTYSSDVEQRRFQ